MIIIRKNKNNFDLFLPSKDHVPKYAGTIDVYKELLSDPRKCVLYLKSVDKCIQLFSIFLLKNKKINHYSEFRIYENEHVCFIRVYDENKMEWKIFKK